MTPRKTRLFIRLAILSTCLFEATGCPQVFANSVIQGTRTFLETGLPTAILAALDLDGLLGLTG